MPRRSVTIHYRRFNPGEASPETRSLQQLIDTALDTVVDRHRLRDRYVHRIQHRADPINDNLFINIIQSTTDYIYGDLVHFTHAQLQAVIDVGRPDAHAVPVEQMQPPERKEYIHSMMHWMVIRNHVFVIQSHTLRTETLETHLAWLFGTKTTVVDAAIPIVLDSKFDEDRVGGDLDDIQEIVVGGSMPVAAPATRTVIAREIERVDSAVLADEHTSGWSKARAVLAAVVGGTAQADAYLRQVPAEAELSVNVHIGYKTRRRDVNRVPLRELETGLRNIGDGQVQVRAKGGNRSVTGDIRLHHLASVNADGSLLVPDDVVRAFLEAYQVLSANGRITE